MNNINTPIKRNSGLQAAEFHKVYKVCNVHNVNIMEQGFSWFALRCKRYFAMPDGVRLKNVRNVILLCQTESGM